MGVMLNIVLVMFPSVIAANVFFSFITEKNNLYVTFIMGMGITFAFLYKYGYRRYYKLGKKISFLLFFCVPFAFEAALLIMKLFDLEQLLNNY